MSDPHPIVAPEPLPESVFGPLLSTGVASCVIASAAAAMTGLGPVVSLGVGAAVGLLAIVVASDRLALLPRRRP